MLVSDRLAAVFKIKKKFNGCHNDVFLKTACVHSCFIKLIEGLGNEVNHNNRLISYQLILLNANRLNYVRLVSSSIDIGNQSSLIIMDK